MNVRLWTWVSISFLCLALVAFAYVARKPLCIDSILVERIDRASETGSSTVYSCSLRRHVPFDSFFAENKADISRRLQSLEKFLDWVSPVNQRINITIFQGRPFTYRIHDHEVFLSQELMQASNQLEKAVLKVWFRERAEVTLLRFPLIEEIYTDILLFLWQGNLEVGDVLSSLTISEQDVVRWPRVIKSWASYCRSPWKLNEHLLLCSKGVGSASHFALDSIRPLLTKALISSIGQLSAQEKVALIKVWAQLPQRWEFNDYQTTEKPGYPEIQDFIQKFLNSLQMSQSDPIMQKLTALLQNQLNAMGFVEKGPQSRIDLLIVKNQMSPADINHLSNLGDSHPENLLASKNGSAFKIYPETEDLSLDFLGEVAILRSLYLFCGSPDWNQLSEIAQISDKVLVVNHCGDAGELNLETLLKNEEDRFVKLNGSLSMMSLHSDSFKFAQKRGDLSLSLMRQIFNNLGGPSRAKLDRHPLFELDKSLNIFHWRGAIDSFNWVRP